MKCFFPSSLFPRSRAAGTCVVAGLVAAVLVALHRVRVRADGLILDDAIHVGQLPAVNASRTAWELLFLPHWQEHPGDTLWRPVTKILWSQLGPGSSLLPLVTILAAAICLALLAWFLVARCRLSPTIAVPAALLPVCHPLAADVLLPYVGQMDLLAAMGLMGALVLMTHRTHGMALAGGGCLALALLSKESVLPAIVALPLAVAAVAPSPREAIRRGSRALMLAGAVIGAWFAVRAWLFAGAEGALGSGGGWYREGERRLSSLELLGRYFVAFFDPRTPQTDYSFLKQPGTSAGLFPFVGAFALVAALAAIAWLFSRPVVAPATEHTDPSGESVGAHNPRTWRMAAAIIWILVFLLPYLQLIPIGALWAGRFAFLSLFGLAWLVAEMVALLPSRSRAMATVALAIALLAGAIQVNRRAPDWSDAVTMWESEVRRRPGHAFAWNNLGVALQYADDSTAGLEAVRHATELFPTYGEAWLSRGRIERALGDHEAGRASYMRAEEFMGDDLDLQMEIARLDAAEGHFENALARLEAMERKGSGNPEYEELIQRVREDLRRVKGEE